MQIDGKRKEMKKKAKSGCERKLKGKERPGKEIERKREDMKGN